MLEVSATDRAGAGCRAGSRKERKLARVLTGGFDGPGLPRLTAFARDDGPGRVAASEFFSPHHIVAIRLAIRTDIASANPCGLFGASDGDPDVLSCSATNGTGPLAESPFAQIAVIASRGKADR